MSKRDPNLVNSWSKLWSLFPKYSSSLFRGCNAKKHTTWKSAAGVRKRGVAKGFSFSGKGMLFWTAEPKRRFGEIPLWRFLPTPSLWVTRSFQNRNISEKNYFCFTCVLQTLLFFFFFLNCLFSPDGYSTLFGRNKLTSEHQDYLRLS